MIIAFHLEVLVECCNQLPPAAAERIMKAVKEACIRDQRFNEACELRDQERAFKAIKRSQAAAKANRTRGRGKGPSQRKPATYANRNTETRMSPRKP